MSEIDNILKEAGVETKGEVEAAAQETVRQRGTGGLAGGFFDIGPTKEESRALALGAAQEFGLGLPRLIPGFRTAAEEARLAQPTQFQTGQVIGGVSGGVLGPAAGLARIGTGLARLVPVLRAIPSATGLAAAGAAEAALPAAIEGKDVRQRALTGAALGAAGGALADILSSRRLREALFESAVPLDPETKQLSREFRRAVERGITPTTARDPSRTPRLLREADLAGNVEDLRINAREKIRNIDKQIDSVLKRRQDELFETFTSEQIKQGAGLPQSVQDLPELVEAGEIEGARRVIKNIDKILPPGRSFSLRQLQQKKKFLNALLSKKSFVPGEQLKPTARAQVLSANAVRNFLVQQAPELEELNRRSGALLELRGVLKAGTAKPLSALINRAAFSGEAIIARQALVGGGLTPGAAAATAIGGGTLARLAAGAAPLTTRAARGLELAAPFTIPVTRAVLPEAVRRTVVKPEESEIDIILREALR